MPRNVSGKKGGYICWCGGVDICILEWIWIISFRPSDDNVPQEKTRLRRLLADVVVFIPCWSLRLDLLDAPNKILNIFRRNHPPTLRLHDNPARLEAALRLLGLLHLSALYDHPDALDIYKYHPRISVSIRVILVHFSCCYTTQMDLYKLISKGF